MTMLPDPNPLPNGNTNATSDDMARLRAELIAEFKAAAKHYAPIPWVRFVWSSWHYTNRPCGPRTPMERPVASSASSPI